MRYMSVHDNKYIRYFLGHKARVISLDVSPINDTFVTSSQDR